QGLGATLFAEAARKTGHSPFPQPASNLSEAYVNPLGVKLGQCTYCGFCERFGCGNYSKASPQTCVLPALVRFPNFSAQTECEVTRINLDGGGNGKKATAETYQKAMTLTAQGSCYSYRDCWLDLDPTYKDRFGRPLLRM